MSLITIHDWFNEYGKSHQNKTNKLIHWICIPLIFWSIISLLSFIPSDSLKIFNNVILDEFSHFGSVVIIFGLLFYLRLSFKIFLGMLIFSIIVLLDIRLASQILSEDIFLYTTISIFTLSWMGQFIGHKIEGKKPSFLKDLQFLLIGPAWLIGFIYSYLKIKY
jgi:uncharacterized membrane protein YGL010W